MRRRVVGLDAGGEEVPTWVLECTSILAAGRELGMREQEADPRALLADDRLYDSAPHVRLRALQREREAAGRAWCAERGLSFSMTVRGLSRPSPAEVAAGCVRGVGPKYVAAERARAEWRR